MPYLGTQSRGKGLALGGSERVLYGGIVLYWSSSFVYIFRNKP